MVNEVGEWFTPDQALKVKIISGHIHVAMLLRYSFEGFPP